MSDNDDTPQVYTDLITACANVLEWENSPRAALCTAGLDEALSLCIHITLVPADQVAAHMQAMGEASSTGSMRVVAVTPEIH